MQVQQKTWPHGVAVGRRRGSRQSVHDVTGDGTAASAVAASSLSLKRAALSDNQSMQRTTMGYSVYGSYGPWIVLLTHRRPSESRPPCAGYSEGTPQ